MPEFNDRPHKNEKTESIAYVRSLIEQARADSKLEDIPKLEQLIELLNSKRYGLVWERHAELVEEEMKTKIPIFTEVLSKKINDNPDSEDYNFLLEGDNLHSLHLLEKTHKGKIDVIYIDPPYNTGNKDFKYNDKFVDSTDVFSHSKWLSFMERRLKVAYELLSEDGVIFVSIDDNEQSQLKLLLSEIFNEENFVGTFFWNKTATPPALSKTIRRKYEFVLAFSKNRNSIKLYGGKTEGGDVPLLNSGNNISDLTVHKEKFEFRIPEGVYEAGQYDSIELLEKIEIRNQHSTTDIKMRGKFKWRQSTLDDEIAQGKYLIVKTLKMSVRFQRPRTSVKVPSDLLSKDENGVLTNEQGKKDFKQLVDNNDFDYTKPVTLIKYLSKMVTNFKKSATVLDFFAGSGTTGQAVIELNAEDGGNRKFILATNNENNIAEEVTYERMKRVSTGTEKYEAHPMNLKYFKTKFIEKDDENLEYALLDNVKTLIELEHGIDLEQSDKAVAFTLSEIQALNLTGIKAVYMRQHSHALMEKAELVRYKDVEIIDVPEYYFSKEMSEAGL